MKILFDHPLPFALAHGGFQIQIEQTMAALGQLGAEVEPVRWWDEAQRGDLIHYFGRPTGSYIRFAHDKGMKVVVAELHTGLGSRSQHARQVQRLVMALSKRFLPRTFTAKMAWDAYRDADAFVALTAWEAAIMRDMFGADPARIHVVPNGVEPVFIRPRRGGDYLVCTAAIAPRKRVVELAQTAISARVPVWIVGRPYAESDAYYQRFLEVQKRSPEFVRYEGSISDRQRLAEVYSGARGFVLLSTQESLSLSALEAAASGCPLLLSDLPWARTVFGDKAGYVSPRLTAEGAAPILRDFYEKSAMARIDYQPLTWEEVARQLLVIYRQLLA